MASKWLLRLARWRRNKNVYKYLKRSTHINILVLSRARGVNFAHCKICFTDFSIAASGLYDVGKHVGGKKHVARAKMAKVTATHFFKPESTTSPLEHKVISAELLFSRFLVEHNVPIAVSDHATKLFKAMFPDSEIAKHYQSSRTKTTSLIKLGGKDICEKVISEIGQKPFSLCTDGSNDRSDKFYPIILRHVSADGEIVSQLHYY